MVIQIINTGVANIKSLQAAFDRLNAPWNLTDSADEIRDASHVVLPGVGAFGAAMESLEHMDLGDLMRRRAEDSDRATLCICLGMQLLCSASQENAGVAGLGVIPAEIQRFPNEVQVPQLGWNRVQPVRHDGLPAPYFSGEAYFANSFRLTTAPPEGWGYAETEYATPFISSFWRGRTLACQFHPELSGAWGRAVLANWISGARIDSGDGA